MSNETTFLNNLLKQWIAFMEKDLLPENVIVFLFSFYSLGLHSSISLFKRNISFQHAYSVGQVSFFQVC